MEYFSAIKKNEILLFVAIWMDFNGIMPSEGFPGGSDSKESACNAGNLGLILESRRSPGEGNGCPCSTLAWRIPWTEEPRGLRCLGSHRVGHD